MRLNLGAGPDPAAGWVNVDVFDYEDASKFDWVGDFLHLPYDEATFDYAVAHHSLQQVQYARLVPVLEEWRRVIVPGGVLRISVPDLLGAFAAWQHDDAAWFPIIDDAERHLGGKLAAYLTWYSTAANVFTRAWLAELCVRAGFVQTAVCVAGLSLLAGSEITALDSRAHESIYLEAQR